VSSSLLYLAIVAVWAFVLVPRWLHRQHAAPEPQVDVDVEVDVEFAAEYDSGAQYYYADARDAQSLGYSAGTAGTAGEFSYAVAVDAEMTSPAAATTAARRSRPPLTRSRVLQARRRLLTMILLLTAVAAACTALKVTAWWVGIAPAAMLGLYLILLREAALADAEHSRQRADLELRAHAARQRHRERALAYAAAMEREAQPSAQIIDISARVGDQLYDQYADAAVRAVGD
jgi:hypothetical protein